MNPRSAAPTLVFDLDGTLAETAGDLFDALNVVLASEGVAPLPVESARSLLGAGGRALIQRGLARAGREIDKPRLDLLFADFLKHYNAHIADRSHLFPGVIGCLDAFSRSGWRLAVCTNKMEASAKLLLEKLEVAERFAFICGQDTFGRAKPDPTPLLETIRASGGAAEGSIMVGDSRTDIDTARAAGVPVIAVDFGYTDVPVAAFAPDAVISHFDQLWAAVAALERA